LYHIAVIFYISIFKHHPITQKKLNGEISSNIKPPQLLDQVDGIYQMMALTSRGMVPYPYQMVLNIKYQISS
jgi:hypothetical protein